MPGVVSSHRPTTKVANKAFKSRKATKGALRDLAKGKVPTEKGLRKTPHQQVMSKFDRRNQARQRQLNKQREHQKENSIFSGRDAAPRNVAVIPLCEDCDAAAAVRSLNQSLDIEAEIGEGLSRVPVDRFKQKLAYFPVKRDLAACMDAARAADFVVLVLSADVEVDDLGELILRSIEGQGLSTLITTVQGLNKIEPVKQRLSVVDSLKSYIKYYHPEQDKIYSLDNRQECANLMRSICSTTPKGVRWRDERSWMLVENVQFPPTDAVDGLTVLTGVVRGKGLKADRLVQVGDWGTFQIGKITAAPLSTKKGKSEGSMAVDEASAPEEPLDVPSEDRDDLAEFAPEEVMMMDDDGGDDARTSVSAPTKKGVLLDDHHYFSDDDEGQAPRAKRLPKGTSAYQAAWYLDDGVSDSGSDMEDFDMADAAHPERSHGPEDGIEEGMAMDAQTEAGASEYPQSEMFVEPNEDDDARQLEAYRASKRDEAEDDKEFPDEIELHPNMLARERLARYRGLKSLRTSTWEEEENRAHEPEEWRRLLQVPDYQGSRSRCTREALVGGVAPGTRVSVHLKGVPASVSRLHDATKPVAMFSLLRHENKHTAVNFLINLSSEHPTPIKAKEELIMQCGPRRLVIRPLFSEGGNTQNDVHKYSRFLHPGQSAVATFIGPVIWGSVPALFYKRQVPSAADAKGDSDEASLPLKLIATGTALPPSTSRVVAKRVILTGHPYHIHKKIVTVRYMFFNKEDVEWFKALPLWTRRGRSGFVKESLGTHGYFKATFDGKINPQDSVGVSLYKRVWPRKSEPFRGSLLPENEESAGGVEEAMEDIA